MNDSPREAAASSLKMRAIFDAQRSAFAAASAPSLQQRRRDLEKLGSAIRDNAGALAAAISADFGNRSRYETEIGEIVPVLAAIRHARHHVRGWMRPKRVAVPLELLPAFFISRSALSASSALGITRFSSPLRRSSPRCPPAIV
jgi:coniferyl-aldehyde dehydrogenase